MNRIARRPAVWSAVLIGVTAGAATIAGCHGAAPAGPPAGAGDTFWLAPNGSEVVLKLVTTQPTVPF